MFIIEDIIKRAKGGDSEATREIIEKFNYFIIKQAGKYKIPSYDFDDLLQHGYLSVIKSINLYKTGKSSFTTYCTNAVINNFNALLKGEIKHFREVPDENMASRERYDFTLGDETTAYEETERIMEAMDKLSPLEKNIITQVYIKDKTLKETSSKCKISYRKAIEVKKSALNKMRKFIK